MDSVTRANDLLAVPLTAVLLAGCSAATRDTGMGSGSPASSEPQAVEATTDSDYSSAPAGFDYDGRRYHLSCGVINPDLVEPASFATGTGDSGGKQPLHRIRGVAPELLLAVPNNGLCDLVPDQAWKSAFPASELTAGGPSAAYNDAWCTASLYGPDPAEGFSCSEASSATPTPASMPR